MRATNQGLKAAHPAVRTYAARHGLDPSAFRSDGRVMLTVDDKYRLQLRSVADGRLALTSMVLDLSTIPAQRIDDMLLRLAGWSAGMMRDYGSTLVLDESAQWLLLQLLLPVSVDVAQLETELADFVNALAFWSRTSSQEAGRL